jgi:serine/threonine protein kinase
MRARSQASLVGAGHRGRDSGASSVVQSAPPAASAEGASADASEVLRLANQLIQELEYAYEKGIVHRGPRPAKIEVTTDGGLKVLDEVPLVDP